MQRNPSTVGIAPGDGLIARFGAVVVYLTGETSRTDRILGAIEAVADARHPGAAIAQRLAAVVFSGGSEPPPFGVVAPTIDGTVILLRGPVVAQIEGAEGTRRISGARAVTWVDEIVREPLRCITVTTDGALPVREVPRTDLRGGVVPGGGFVLRVALGRSGKSGERAQPEAGRSGARSGTGVVRAGTGGDPVSTAVGRASTGLQRVGNGPDPAGVGPGRQRGAPGQVGTEPHQASNGADRASTRTGRSDAPAQGANSDATAEPPATAPAGMDAMFEATGESEPVAAQEAAGSSKAAGLDTYRPADPIVLRKLPPLAGARPRPARLVGTATYSDTPVGALVLPDGSTYPLDRPYVIGRGPMADDSVRAASAAPLPVPRDRHVSRVHAHISIDRGKVFVRDAATPAGTFIAAPDADTWTRITTDPIELPPGWRVRIGERVLTYRTGKDATQANGKSNRR